MVLYLHDEFDVGETSYQDFNWLNRTQWYQLLSSIHAASQWALNLFSLVDDSFLLALSDWCRLSISMSWTWKRIICTHNVFCEGQSGLSQHVHCWLEICVSLRYITWTYPRYIKAGYSLSKALGKPLTILLRFSFVQTLIDLTISGTALKTMICCCNFSFWSTTWPQHRSDLVAVSLNHGYDAQSDDVWCIDTRGVLTMCVCKETYEKLGLLGQKMPFKNRSGERYGMWYPSSVALPFISTVTRYFSCRKFSDIIAVAQGCRISICTKTKTERSGVMGHRIYTEHRSSY